MQKIALIYMGGTFGCVGEPLAPMPESAFLKQLKAYLPQHAHIDCFAAISIKDSSACTAVDWLLLIQQIQQLQTDYQYFVVIHGTDTMSYAAATLARFLQHSSHVVLTGSQYPLLRPEGDQLLQPSDALDNLNFAFEQVLQVNAGVYLAFDQQIFYAATSLKQHTTALDAFYGQVYDAQLQTKAVAAFQVEAQHIEQAKQLNILNWMLQPIETDKLAKNLEQLALDPPHFLILQGYGMGNIAASAALLAALQQLRQRGCICILTTQVPHGGLEQRYAISQWLLETQIKITDCQGHADLYAKILKIYLQYRSPDQCTAHWYDHFE